MKDTMRALKEETCKVWRDHILPMKKKVTNRLTSRPTDKRTDNPLKVMRGRIKKTKCWKRVPSNGQMTLYTFSRMY